ECSINGLNAAFMIGDDRTMRRRSRRARFVRLTASSLKGRRTPSTVLVLGWFETRGRPQAPRLRPRGSPRWAGFYARPSADPTGFQTDGSVATLPPVATIPGPECAGLRFLGPSGGDRLAH